jgi:hypothetical protein
MTEEKSCVERHRIYATEAAVEGVSEQLESLKNTFTTIERDVREDLNKFVSSIQGVIVRMEERDRRANEIMLDNRSTFERLGRLLTDHAERLVEIEVKVSRIDTLEKIVYALLAGVGGLFIWMLQKLLT